jgi:hypothetical protein
MASQAPTSVQVSFTVISGSRISVGRELLDPSTEFIPDEVPGPWTTLLELDSDETPDEYVADDENTLPDSTLDEDIFPFKSGAEMGSLDSPLHATNKTAENNNVAKDFKENLLKSQKNRFRQI